MIEKIVEENLDGKEVVVVDFENFQGIPTDLLDENGIYYLFCGKTTKKKADEYRIIYILYSLTIQYPKTDTRKLLDYRNLYITIIYSSYIAKQKGGMSYENYKSIKNANLPK